jgi:hypothetical protein
MYKHLRLYPYPVLFFVTIQPSISENNEKRSDTSLLWRQVCRIANGELATTIKLHGI